LFSSPEKNRFYDELEHLEDIFVALFEGFVDVLIPPKVIRPWFETDEMDQRKKVVEIILQRGAGETPSMLPGECVDSLSLLDDPAFNIMSFVEDDSEPIVSI
jgi:hypothetical protein